MARTARIERPGAAHWVTARCVRDTRLTEEDRVSFLEVLGRVTARHLWSCLAFSVLEDGYLLVVTTRRPNLSRGMRDLNGEFTQATNRRRSRTGPIFHGRFHSALVEPGVPLLEVCREVALSPVRSGLCRKPGKWAWGSFPATAGLVESPAFLDDGWILEQFGPKPKKARGRYEKYVKAGVEGGPPVVRGGRFVGSKAFGEALRRSPAPSAGNGQKGRRSLSLLFSKGVLADRSRRDAALVEARNALGYGLIEVAQAAGLHPATVSRIARKSEAALAKARGKDDPGVGRKKR